MQRFYLSMSTWSPKMAGYAPLSAEAQAQAETLSCEQDLHDLVYPKELGISNLQNGYA